MSDNWSDRGSRGGRARGRGGRGYGGSDGSSSRGRGSPDRGGRGGFRGDRGGGFRGGRGGFRGAPGPREQAGVFQPGAVPIDPRLQNNSEDALIQSLQTLRINDNELPIRPDFGTIGTPIKLRANFFPVKIPKRTLYEYNVKVEPPVSVKRVLKRIYQLAEQTNDWVQAGMRGKVAHDRVNKLISCFKLPQPLVIHVPFTDEGDDETPPPQQQAKPKGGGKKGKKEAPKEYTLTIEYTLDLDTQNLLNYLSGQPQYRGYDILPIISALNLVLAAYPNRSVGDGVMVGRNKFFHPSAAEPPFSLGGGLEAWRGFYSSVRPAHKQLMVNVNVCTTAFYVPGNLADGLQSFMRASFSANPNAFCRQVRIKTTHLGYRKTISGVARSNAKQHSFDSEFGRVTVEAYFKKKYNITLRYPDLPLINVAGKNAKKENLLPAEVCIILEKQSFKGKLLEEHTAEMIKVACRPPNVNAMAITQRGIQELGYFDEQDPLRAFGISIGKEMAIVPGRILSPPNIRYGQGAPRVDERAGWNLRDVKFAVGGRLDTWIVLLIRDGNERSEFQGPQDPALKPTIDGFISMCRKSGVNVGAPPDSVVETRLPRKTREQPIRADAIQAIRATLTSVKKKPKFVFVILSNGDRHVYSGLKHLTDSYLDVATICVQVEKLRKDRGQVQYFANVALKLNMKMGGVNHRLEGRSAQWLNMAPTMLVGIDVTHPGPGTVKGTPSIAAVVASTDNNFGQFPASLRIQESRKEMVTDLCDMMVERLNAYKAKSNVLPQRILVYRDGVSEGQFQTVVNEELPEMTKAFTKLKDGGKAYTPKLTIVICGKRHHTRFFPTEPQHAANDGNPRPGTVVDRGITAVYEFDFFLQAHGGLQGTTRPTHYYVVHDKIGFTADVLQPLTNDVSYMFARATKAVSLVSPAYYADLACERGRCYLHKLLQGITDSNTTATTNDENLAEVYREGERLWHGGVATNLRNTMFYL